MATRDRRDMGSANSFLEPVVDLGRVRRERLAKVQRAMAARGIGALLLTDIMNIRYCTGVAVMHLVTSREFEFLTLLERTGRARRTLVGDSAQLIRGPYSEQHATLPKPAICKVEDEVVFEVPFPSWTPASMDEEVPERLPVNDSQLDLGLNGHVYQLRRES